MSNLSLTDFHFRRATLDDRKQVLTIAQGLYWGTDVLPALYNEYITDESRIFYVATYNDQVVRIFYSTCTGTLSFHLFYSCSFVGLLHWRSHRRQRNSFRAANVSHAQRLHQPRPIPSCAARADWSRGHSKMADCDTHAPRVRSRC